MTSSATRRVAVPQPPTATRRVAVQDLMGYDCDILLCFGFVFYSYNNNSVYDTVSLTGSLNSHITVIDLRATVVDAPVLS